MTARLPYAHKGISLLMIHAQWSAIYIYLSFISNFPDDVYINCT